MRLSPFTVNSLFAASLLAAAAPALAQDSDADGVPDAADTFPCDGTISAVQYAPSASAWSLLVFEDQWPDASDLDFNDVAVRANYRIYRDAQGRAVRLTALIDPLAVGGQYSSGLGLQLPAARAGASARRRVAGGAWQTVALESDSNATMIVSPNLRELFANQQGPINSEPAAARVTGQQIELEVTFSPAATLNGALAPFDLFIFRDYDFGHQIHLPRYRGTAAMDVSFFNRGVDGTDASRAFVDRQGLPYALDLSTSNRYPYERRAIHALFPEIIGFASSGGTTHTNFYASSVDAAQGFDISALAVPAEATPSRACIPTNAGPFTRIDVHFEQATATPWVTMWEIGLMNGATRVRTGYSVSASTGNGTNCDDGDSSNTWCINVGPPASFSFVATSGNLPTHTGLMLWPWGNRWPSQFRVEGRRPDGTTVVIFSYTGGDSGWASSVSREFAYPTAVVSPAPMVPVTTNNTVLGYTGGDQTFTVPAGVTAVVVSMWGAGGGGGAPSRSQASHGGGGGHTSAVLAVTPGETLTVVVGGGGLGARPSGAAYGGYGGGGNADTWLGAGGGGGGRSAIRRNGVELVTAGGGGGGGYDYAGAAGGGSIGLRNMGDGGGGYGGTQSAGGAGGGSSTIGQPGIALRGGNGAYAGGGGGGGWFGGGGSGTSSGYGCGGGGGSGYIGGAGVSSGQLTAGAGNAAGNASSSDRGGAGTGGNGVTSGQAGDGAPGRVIIRF